MSPVEEGCGKIRDDNLPPGLYANNPLGTVAQQRDIMDAIIRGLDHAPDGATARLAAFTGVESPLRNAIQSAHNRGVGVRVCMDDKMGNSEQQADLANILGTNRSNRSCFTSLQGTGRTGPGNAHGKIFAIDQTYIDRPFTMIGSSNLGSNDTFEKWNTMYAMRRPDVHRFFSQIHEEMMKDAPVPDVYRKGGPFGQIHAFVYPEVAGSWETDDRYQFLTDGIGDYTGVTIYTSQSQWALNGAGTQLCNLLISRKNQGADVRVNGGGKVSDNVINHLQNGGVNAVKTVRMVSGREISPHCKYWVVKSNKDSECKIRDVSLNTGGDDHGEEFAIEVHQNRKIVNDYVDHFNKVRNVMN